MMGLLRDLKNSEWLPIILGGIVIEFYLFGYVLWMIQVHGDDNENDLGLCLNYHVQKACDRVEFKYFQNHSYEEEIWKAINQTCAIEAAECEYDK